MNVLQGRVALVTGAGQGIGRGIATALAAAGAAVMVLDRNGETARTAAAELNAGGATAAHVATDVGDEAQVEKAMQETMARFGRLDILINNAQALRAQVPFEDHSDADFELAIRSGLWGTFHMMRAAFPVMRERGGRIINLASSAGTHGRPGLAAYAAAKEGIRGLTKVAANEWGVHQITVNVICPSGVTPASQAWAAEHPDLFEAAVRSVPLGRLADAVDDVGAAVVYLAGPGCFVTGQTLMVNGGATIMP